VLAIDLKKNLTSFAPNSVSLLHFFFLPPSKGNKEKGALNSVREKTIVIIASPPTRMHGVPD
jgi:hypothetical protein